jgi:SAM-dependent methyltransferase
VNLSGWRPFERAIEAAHSGDALPLIVRSDVGEEERIDPSLFLRGESEFERWERLALGRTEGRVLDVGAGAGPHALVLQARGLVVTAIDLLPGAVRVMQSRGVIDARAGDCFSLPPGRWDTLLYLMNGTMPFGTLHGLRAGLSHARSRVTSGGRLILDSTDLRCSGMVEKGEEREDGRYVGEAQYRFEYDGVVGDLIPQLFVDPERLEEVAAQAGWAAESIWSDGAGHYLAELVPMRVNLRSVEP